MYELEIVTELDIEWENRMFFFVIFEFIDVYLLRGRRIVRIIVCEYLVDIRIIIVCFGFFFRHLHPFVASWSIVVTE